MLHVKLLGRSMGGFFLGASNSVVIPQFGRFVEFTSQANSWGLGIVRTY